jgi:hypothetical protein
MHNLLLLSYVPRVICHPVQKKVTNETPLLIRYRNALSRMQFWHEKCLGKPAQFKTRLQSKRAHQLVKTDPQISFKPKEYGKSYKELRGHEKPYQDSNWFPSSQGMVTLMRRCPKVHE